MDFIRLDPSKANRLINHGPTVLVTARHQGKNNVMTAAWCMPASKSPPMVALAIGPSRFTHDMIINSGEFTVCVPGSDLGPEVICCGTCSGREVEDKFARCGLTPVTGEEVSAPLIRECLGGLECRLDSHPTAGDHSIIVGEVVAVWVRNGAFHERFLVGEAPTLHHLGGREFCLPGEIIRVPK